MHRGKESSVARQRFAADVLRKRPPPPVGERRILPERNAHRFGRATRAPRDGTADRREFGAYGPFRGAVESANEGHRPLIRDATGFDLFARLRRPSDEMNARRFVRRESPFGNEDAARMHRAHFGSGDSLPETVLQGQLGRCPAARRRARRELAPFVVENRDRKQRGEETVVERQAVPAPRRIEPLRDRRGEERAVPRPKLPLIVARQ
jgi:hypothetical protein